MIAVFNGDSDDLCEEVIIAVFGGDSDAVDISWKRSESAEEGRC